MTDLRLRPRFRVETRCSTTALLHRLEQRLADSETPVRGNVYHTSCVLRMRAEDVHFWSPQLHLSVDPGSEINSAVSNLESGQDARASGADPERDGAVVHGIYGPRPAVWSLFIALYVAVGFAGAMGVIFGYSQSLLGDPALAYWSGPCAAILALLIYIVARQGRRLGYAQMVELRSFFDAVLAECTSDGTDQ